MSAITLLLGVVVLLGVAHQVRAVRAVKRAKMQKYVQDAIELRKLPFTVRPPQFPLPASMAHLGSKEQN